MSQSKKTLWALNGLNELIVTILYTLARIALKGLTPA